MAFASRDTSAGIRDYDVVILGGGIAGLSVALNLPPHLHAALITKAPLGECNTRYAQGGLAAAVGPDDDPEIHLHDTLAAGAGLVDEAAARILVTEARDAVAWLLALHTRFDERAHAGQAEATLALGARFDLAREAAHSRRRVLHAGDATGAEIERALVVAAQARSALDIFEHTTAVELLVRDEVCAGVSVLAQGEPLRLTARLGVVLANGGAGRLWLRTSNPVGATGDGMALAWRAGATLGDLEFTQFHPTTLVPPVAAAEPFLISEAVRGEGAYLRNGAGERFMPRYSADAELAPRDVVARAILGEMLRTGASHVFLDLRHLPAAEVYSRFPTIAATCHMYGLDLAADLIPVAPAAHYFMGGVAVDTWGRSTLPGLYAAGEVACTGVHGANRLASNSLLEGLVFGRRIAQILGSADADSVRTGWPRVPILPGESVTPAAVIAPSYQLGLPYAQDVRDTLRTTLWEHVSLRRDAGDLAAAQQTLQALAAAAQTAPLDPETSNMLLIGQLITAAALAREESRGAHFREDYPQRDPHMDGRHTLLAHGNERIATVTRKEVGSHV